MQPSQPAQHDVAVLAVVPGGLSVELKDGREAFLPRSLVDIRQVGTVDLNSYVGQKIDVALIEENPATGKVIVSRRAVQEARRKKMREAILDRLKPGDQVTGTVSNIVNFGAFVDIGGVDGIIHVSELAWKHVNHPSEVLHVGQAVTVKVLDIDRARQRIAFGLKQTQPDPWTAYVKTVKTGDVLEGTVTKLVTFGAFVAPVDHPDIEGLVHISEISDEPIVSPRKVLEREQAVTVLVVEVDDQLRRTSFSMKRANVT